jgi:transposase InsO family protein
LYHVFSGRLRERCPSVPQNMSRKGNCWDNTCTETFFKTLKRGLETLDDSHSEAEVRKSIFRYLEAYYNRIRMHSTLEYGRLMCLTLDRSLNRVYLIEASP